MQLQRFKLLQNPTLVLVNEVVEDTIPEVQEAPETFFTVENKKMNVQFTSKGGIVNKLVLKEYQRSDSTDLVLIEPGSNNFSYTIPLNSGIVETRNLDFTVKSQAGNSIVLAHNFAGGGSVEQEYNLTDGYLVDYKIRLIDLQENISSENTIQSYSLALGYAPATYKNAHLDNERRVSTVYYKYKSEERA